MTQPPHDIHIDHLVLPAGTVGRQRVREAVERELTRLAQSGQLNTSGAQGAVRHSEIRATATRGVDARTLAASVGAAIKSGGES